jgi:hypothetical protein
MALGLIIWITSGDVDGKIWVDGGEEELLNQGKQAVALFILPDLLSCFFQGLLWLFSSCQSCDTQVVQYQEYERPSLLPPTPNPSMGQTV